MDPKIDSYDEGISEDPEFPDAVTYKSYSLDSQGQPVPFVRAKEIRVLFYDVQGAWVGSRLLEPAN